MGCEPLRPRPRRRDILDEPDETHLRIVASPEDEVLGLRALGAGAPELIQALTPALAKGITTAELGEVLQLHPTSAEEVIALARSMAGRQALAEGVPPSALLPPSRAARLPKRALTQKRSRRRVWGSGGEGGSTRPPQVHLACMC